MEIRESVVKLIESLDDGFLKTLEAPCRELAKAAHLALEVVDDSEDPDILSMMDWVSINIGKSHRHPNPAPGLGWNIEGYTPDEWGFDDGFVIDFDGAKVVGWRTKNWHIEEHRGAPNPC